VTNTQFVNPSKINQDNTYFLRKNKKELNVYFNNMNTITYYLEIGGKHSRVRWISSKHWVTYLLRVQTQEENFRWTLQKHRGQPLTGWTCKHRQRSGDLHRSIENSYLPAMDVETSREGQVDFTEALRQPLTSWECRHKQRRSGRFDRSMMISHLHAEDAGTSREGHVDFTEAWRTATYILRMQAQAEG